MSHRWNPYDDNGGTYVAVRGQDFVAFAADTRLTRGYSILSRDETKFFQLTPTCYLLSVGMKADIDAFRKVLEAQIRSYQFKHRRLPNYDALARLLTVILYSRRFFPYYSFNCLAGLDDKGQGQLRLYDAVGSDSTEAYGAAGQGFLNVIPILEARLSQRYQKQKLGEPSREEVKELLKGCLRSASEIDISTGDTAEVVILDKGGVESERWELGED